MRLKVKGPPAGALEKELRQRAARIERAAAAAVREETKKIHREVQDETVRTVGRRLARSWGKRVFRRRGGGAKGVVWTRTWHILSTFEHGAIIEAKAGRFLTIPTGFNRSRGLRGGRTLFRPDQLQGAFVKRSKKGNLLLFAPVRHAQAMSRGGVRDKAYVETKLLGSGRKRRTEKLLAARAVPMYVLRRRVAIRKRMGVIAVATAGVRRLPATLRRHIRGF